MPLLYPLPLLGKNYSDRRLLNCATRQPVPWPTGSALTHCMSPWAPSDPAFFSKLFLFLTRYIRILRRFHSAIIIGVMKSYSALFQSSIYTKNAPAVHNKSRSKYNLVQYGLISGIKESFGQVNFYLQMVFSFVYILKGDISYQAFGTEALVLKWFGRPQTCCAQEARVQSRPASLHKACIFFAFCPHFSACFCSSQPGEGVHSSSTPSSGRD